MKLPPIVNTALVRTYGKELSPEKAIDRAMTECINNGVLAEYLLAREAALEEGMDSILDT